MLVYVPYFVTTYDVSEPFCTVAGCVYAHKVIVQSEKIRNTYIRVFKEAFGSKFGKPEDKFIATKNRPIMLKRAIASVAAQTFGEYVHVIVNDSGSSDTVEKLVDSGGNKGKTVILHNRESMGMESASNAGIRSCESDYILIHDDDSLYPDFLEKTLASCCLENSRAAELKWSVSLKTKRTSKRNPQALWACRSSRWRKLFQMII